MHPSVSVIVLTRNEEANIGDVLTSLLAQEDASLEVLVVDSASSDRTLDIAREHADAHPGKVRILECNDMPIGPARNLGIDHARGGIVAFVSADATAAPGWAASLVDALAHADIVYGRQEHTPTRWTAAAAVRGLRYHHFDDGGRAPPETFASNVNAGIRRATFERLRYVTHDAASALDDILFTREAQRMGLRIAYEARMLVRHKDTLTLRSELSKNQREGYGWGLLVAQLGFNRLVLAWGLALAIAAGATLATSVRSGATWAGVMALVAIAYAPTLRRVARAGGRLARQAPGALVLATLAGPALDLAFLAHYVRGLRDRKGDLTGVLLPPPPQPRRT